MNVFQRNRGDRRQAGFTLVELMVTIAIGAILMTIAVPTYQYEMRKSRRTEAKNTALDAAVREERFYATQNQYANYTECMQYTTGTCPSPAYVAGTSCGDFPYASGTYYQIQCIQVTAPIAAQGSVTLGGFAVVVSPATGSPQSSDTQCQSFIVDQTGKTWSTNVAGDSPTSPTGTITTSTCWP